MGRLLLILALVCVFLGGVMSGLGARLAGPSSLLEVAGVVSLYAAIYSMRRTLEIYYNTVEPMRLRMSGVMTFFFTTVYLQYHMNRIAMRKWKALTEHVPQP
jgi:hypothetical protein